MRILYTGAFRFPDGDAAAFRVLAVGRLLRELGHHVEFAGWESTGAPGGQYEHDGFLCHPQAEFREASVHALSRLAGFLRRGARTLRWLRAQPRFDVVIAYNPPALFAADLLKAAATNATVVVIDSTEWYESSHLPGGRLGIAAAENWARMQRIYPRCRNIICISTFLERHFAGRNVLRLPPLLPATTLTGPRDARPDIMHGVHLLYAGQAGRKDRLGSVLRLLPGLHAAVGRPVRLTVAGMTDADLALLATEAGLSTEDLRGHVSCLGRVSRDTVAALYMRSHLSLLFREDQRYARAGFPTKAMESWAGGCVILGNAVGDFGAIASDGVDAILIDEASLAAELPRRLRDVAERGEFDTMSRAAEATARRVFAPEAHAEALRRFLTAAIQDAGRPAA